jgi:hypothetical protein
MPLSIRYCRAIAACAPSYDLVAPPTLHPAAPTFCGCGGLCSVPVCGAPGCAYPAGVCEISYAYCRPPSLHSCRVPPPRTWRLLRRSSPATTHSRGVLLALCKHDWHSFGDCYRPRRVHRFLRRHGVIVFLFEGLCGITHRLLRSFMPAASAEVTSRMSLRCRRLLTIARERRMQGTTSLRTFLCGLRSLAKPLRH